MSILIKNAILGGKKRDIYIENNIIKKIGRNLDYKAEETIDGRGEKAAMPSLVNGHTHAAMTLFRGYADDLPLREWLQNRIWPLELKLTPEDVYWGTKLAILEMIKSGTTCFNDMYWYPEAAISAAREMGMRAVIGLIVVDFDKQGSKENITEMYHRFMSRDLEPVQLAVAPHSIYTVSKENLTWAKDFAQSKDLVLHLHISETEEEVIECQKRRGVRPAEYLEEIGFLGDNVVLIHGNWLSDKETEILGKRKCSLVYSPCSNMKLAVGEVFPYRKLAESKANICLGTDGVASNNNLDLFEEMKIGALLQKHKERDPAILKAAEMIQLATVNGAKAFKINAGEIAEGKMADLILIDLNQICFSPGHNFASDLVYCACGNCVSDVVCNGRILMREREVENEKEIREKATARAKRLVKKVKQ
jgi:5-methylthioadenosine/S-adenosylhomocysteine deaminase